MSFGFLSWVYMLRGKPQYLGKSVGIVAVCLGSNLEGEGAERRPWDSWRELFAVETFPPVTYKNIGEMNFRLQCVGSWVCGFEMKWAWHLRDIRHRQGPKDA